MPELGKRQSTEDSSVVTEDFQPMQDGLVMEQKPALPFPVRQDHAQLFQRSFFRGSDGSQVVAVMKFAIRTSGACVDAAASDGIGCFCACMQWIDGTETAENTVSFRKTMYHNNMGFQARRKRNKKCWMYDISH